MSKRINGHPESGQTTSEYRGPLNGRRRALNGFLSNRGGSVVKCCHQTKPFGQLFARLLGRGWPNRQLFRFIQMMLDGRKRLLSKLLHVGIIAFRRIFFKKVHRLLMRIDLLIGIRLVEVLSGCTV